MMKITPNIASKEIAQTKKLFTFSFMFFTTLFYFRHDICNFCEFYMK